MKKRILITGSSGHCGHQLADSLKADFELVGIDMIEGKYTTHLGNLLDQEFIKRVVQGVDAVLHTASLHAPHVATHSRKDFIETNINGTLNLLEAAQENRIHRFIYTSTTSLYGESMENDNQAVWVTEETPTIPRDIYDITKITAEGLCKDFFNKNGLQTCVLRVSRFWNEPLEQRIFYRMYRGLDVRDVVLAHRLALEKAFDKFNIFNISAQSIFTQDDLFDLKYDTHTVLQKKIPELLEYYKAKNWEIPTSIDRVYVIDKAKNELGYYPKYNIGKMLAETQLH